MKVVELHPRPARAPDEWAAPHPSTIAAIEAVGRERGYSSDFISEQRDRLVELLRHLHGFGRPPIPVSFQLPCALQAAEREEFRIELDRVLRVQAEAKGDAINDAVLAYAIDIAFPPTAR